MASIYWLGTSTDTSTAGNYSGGSLPTTGDDLALLPEYTGAITQNTYSLQSIAIGDFSVHPGNTSTIGSFSAYLKLDPDSFTFSGTGQAFIDLQSAAIDATVNGSYKTSEPGKRGLYLKGSAIATLHVSGGDVGLAFIHGETSTATNVKIDSGTLNLGSGATVTNATIHGGTLTTACNIATLNVHGGTVYLDEASAITTLNLYQGTVIHRGTGTITTATITGGVLDMDGTQSRTITTLKINPGGAINYDPGVVTITNKSDPDTPISITTSRM